MLMESVRMSAWVCVCAVCVCVWLSGIKASDKKTLRILNILVRLNVCVCVCGVLIVADGGKITDIL